MRIWDFSERFYLNLQIRKKRMSSYEVLTRERTRSPGLNVLPFSKQWKKGMQKPVAKTDKVQQKVRQEFSARLNGQKKKKSSKKKSSKSLKWNDVVWNEDGGPLQLAISCRFKRAWNFITFALFKQISQFVNLKDKLGETRVALLPRLRRPCFPFIKITHFATSLNALSLLSWHWPTRGQFITSCFINGSNDVIAKETLHLGSAFLPMRFCYTSYRSGKGSGTIVRVLVTLASI